MRGWISDQILQTSWFRTGHRNCARNVIQSAPQEKNEKEKRKQHDGLFLHCQHYSTFRAHKIYFLKNKSLRKGRQATRVGLPLPPALVATDRN